MGDDSAVKENHLIEVSAVAVELKALSEEVAKLMNHNEKLAAELAASKAPPPNPNMWVVVANLKKSQGMETDDSRLTRENLQADSFDV
ncbi:hypothetical protein K1719_035008 [Acacia pycnantha]|nr:hypothetical protein K1719_035008 [Acacia pycnantha]